MHRNTYKETTAPCSLWALHEYYAYFMCWFHAKSSQVLMVLHWRGTKQQPQQQQQLHSLLKFVFAEQTKWEPDCNVYTRRGMPTLTLTIIYSYYRHLITQFSIVIISVRLADSFVFIFVLIGFGVIYSVHFNFNFNKNWRKEDMASRLYHDWKKRPHMEGGC